MAEPVKRTYNSPRRLEQAAATRREILEAARRLFEQQRLRGDDDGRDRQAEAGVALKTVYVAFETKSGVLLALWHVMLRGDEGEVPVAEQPWYRETPRRARPRGAAPAQRAQLTRRASSGWAGSAR